jgi:hypothetical protein
LYWITQRRAEVTAAETNAVRTNETERRQS